MFSKIHFKRNKKINQEKLEKELQLSQDFQNPEIYSNYSNSEIATLNEIFNYSNWCREIYPRQDTIAKKIDRCTKTVNRVIKKFDNKLFLSIYRHYKSNIYKLPQEIYDINVRRKLQSIFPALKYFPIVLLLSHSNRNVPQYYSLLKNGCLYNKPVLPPNSKLTDCKSKSLNVVKKGDKVMINSQTSFQNETKSYLDSVDSLNNAAKIQLSVVPVLVLKEAFRLISNKELKSNPFGYLKKICLVLCGKYGYQIPDIPFTTQIPHYQHVIEKPNILTSKETKLSREENQTRIDRICAEKLVECQARGKIRRQQEWEALSPERKAQRLATQQMFLNILNKTPQENIKGLVQILTNKEKM